MEEKGAFKTSVKPGEWKDLVIPDAGIFIPDVFEDTPQEGTVTEGEDE
jgi:hypothetical protein